MDKLIKELEEVALQFIATFTCCEPHRLVAILYTAGLIGESRRDQKSFFKGEMDIELFRSKVVYRINDLRHEMELKKARDLEGVVDLKDARFHQRPSMEIH